MQYVSPNLKSKALSNNNISIVLLSYSLGSTVSTNLLLCSEQPTLWLLKLSTASRTVADQGWKMWRAVLQLSGLACGAASPEPAERLLSSGPSLDILKMRVFCCFPLSVCPSSSCCIWWPLRGRASSGKWLHSRDYIFIFLLLLNMSLNC